jgi:hypothetical protein
MRPFNPRQAAENEAFLQALRRTGNPRLAAASLGVHRSTYSKRRARCAVFATRWDAAILACHSALKVGGGPRLAEQSEGLKTKGGEIVVGRTRGGRLQLRRAPPGRMTAAGEQHFLGALSASANVRLSAAATGFTHSAFYQRKKKQPAFAREMRISLTIAYDRLECAAFAAGAPGAPGLADWRRNDLPPLMPLSWNQAFQLLCLHEKSVRQSWDRPHRRKRRGEPWETYTERLRAMWTVGNTREAEDAALRAAHYEETGTWRYAHEQPPPPLPPLHLVTGWSKADPAKVKHNPDLALFGGWRIEDWHKRRRRRGQSG